MTRFALYAAWLLPLTIAACGDDDDDKTTTPPIQQNIVATASADARFSTLVGLVADAGLVDTLSGPGPFTVFAPTNDAFAKIDAATLASLQADTDALSKILQYHVVSGAVKAETVVTLTEATTITDATVAIRVEGSDVIITDGMGNDSKVIITDIEASNGVIHAIDTVLMPAAEGPGNIVEVAASVGSFGTMIGAAQTAGLATTLSNDGPFTVFAPTDAAFTALGVDLAPVSADVIGNILLHHVVAGEQDSGAVVAASSFTSAANLSLAIDASGSPITIGGAELSDTIDVDASNGIIHVLNAVIVPPTIVDVAAATPDLSVLVSAVGAASAAVQAAVAPDTLAGDSPITVFAPTNAAFTASGIDLNSVPQATLDGVLAHHVVGAQAISGSLSDGQVVSTLNGDITININGSGDISITDGMGNTANVVATLKDIRTLNGVVHVIDTVMMPAAQGPGNIVDVASAAGSFGTLLDAATGAGLADTLANDGPFTVFAPTDAAFTALGVDLSPVSTDVIGNILLHHVVAGEQDSSAVVGASSFTSAANLPLAIDTSGAPITIGGAALSETLDVDASNGIIHIMDGVIVPPTILEVAAATPDLSTLVTAVGAASAGVQGAVAPSTLTGDAPITVFAPTNAAFAATGLDLGSLPQATIDAVLAHHVVGAQAISSSLTDGQMVTTLNGDITININASGDISVTDGMGNTANVVATLKDIRTLTGVVHVIDAVLMP